MEKLIFDFEAMNRIFPFHFVIGQDLSFTQIGKSLMKLDSSIQAGNHWNDHFKMLRPGIEKNDFQHFCEISNHLVIIINHKTRISFQGQWEKVDGGNALMFVGAP